MLIAFFGRHGSELAPEDRAALDAHVSACPGCASAVASEREFDARIGKAMMAVPIPNGLQGRLLDGTAAARGAWYRQKFFYAAGLAAAIFVAVGGYVAYEIEKAPTLDINSLVAAQDQLVREPGADVNSVLGAHRLTYAPDRPFDLRQLAAAGERKFPGQRRTVPFFLLVNSSKNAQATVYVVKDTDFNWKGLPPATSTTASEFGYQVAVVRDRRRDDVAYVVLYTGAGLELFLEDRTTF